MRFATNLWKSEGQPATSGQRFQPECHVQDQVAGMSQVDVGSLNTSAQPNYQKPPTVYSGPPGFVEGYFTNVVIG